MRNRLSAYDKDTGTDCKPDHQLEKHKVKVEEQIAGLQPGRHDLVKDKNEMHNVSLGNMSQPSNLIHHMSVGDGMSHREGNEGNKDK